MIHTHPAQLWIGKHADLVLRTQEYFTQLWCKKNACNSCITCTQINAQQYHATSWLYPEKQYTLEQIDPIFSAISFSLAQGQEHFFIIQKADLLTQNCANSLLKSIEEPPKGYNFILLAERLDHILPTIRSRCIVQTFTATHTNTAHPIIKHMEKGSALNALQFMKDLESHTPSEHESLQLIDALLIHWIHTYKQAITNKDALQATTAERIIATLQQAVATPAMPGSSKMFWKNVFLQLSLVHS